MANNENETAEANPAQRLFAEISSIHKRNEIKQNSSIVLEINQLAQNCTPENMEETLAEMIKGKEKIEENQKKN